MQHRLIPGQAPLSYGKYFSPQLLESDMYNSKG